MWNQKNSADDPYLQGRNGDTDVENGLVIQVGGGEVKVEQIEKVAYTHYQAYMCKIATGKLLYNTGYPTWYFVTT